MTGIEILQQVYEEMKSLKEEVRRLSEQNALVDANLKVLNNRIAKLLTGEQSVIQGTIQQSITPTVEAKPVERPTITTRIPEKKETSQAVRTGRLVYKKVFGYLKNSQNSPIEDALVLIYNNNNEVCASSTTDPTGLWETMLVPGRYVAECKKDGFAAANKSFEFQATVKEYEVK